MSVREVTAIVCPRCRRPGFTRPDIFYSTLDGSVLCRRCGGIARLSMFCRWIISCLLAIVLSIILLYGDVFYSGHLFVVSIFVIFGGWAGISWVAFRYLTLEEAPEHAPITRRQGAVLVVAILLTALLFDRFMASRFEAGARIEATELRSGSVSGN